MTELYEYEDYKLFLNAELDKLDRGGRGARARMSRSIGCHTSYTAQVLRGSSHFSLEQIEAVSEFLGLSEEEGNFLLLLTQYAKAGSYRLKARFEKQIKSIWQNKRLLKNQLQVEPLIEHHQLRYYSSWLYGAVHALAAASHFNTAERIGQRLGVSKHQVTECIQFLLEASILKQGSKAGLQVGKAQIHLGADSFLTAKHHLNWRLKAMQAIEGNPQNGLHYSSVISIAKKDEEFIRAKCVKLLKELKPMIRDSAAEEVFSLNIDFFML